MSEDVKIALSFFPTAECLMMDIGLSCSDINFMSNLIRSNIYVMRARLVHSLFAWAKQKSFPHCYKMHKPLWLTST